MRLDHTYIAIRQRNILEIVDLSLHVIRDYLGPLCGLLLIGAVPFFLVDWFLIGWMANDLSDGDYVGVYVWVMALLVANQAHVGTVFISQYLGKAIFTGRPAFWETVRSVFSTSSYFIWIHGFTRMVLPVILLTFFMRSPGSDSDTFGFLVFTLSVVVLVGLFVRGLRPFASEILMLEKTPIKELPGQINYKRRSRSLHSAAASELFGRFCLMAIFTLPLAFIFYALLLLVDSTLNLHVDGEQTLVTYYWPISLWIVAGIMAVVRFLSYLDIRIRQEGWAVELRMRAEAIRFQKNFG